MQLLGLTAITVLYFEEYKNYDLKIKLNRFFPVRSSFWLS